MDCPALERAEMHSLENKGHMCFYRCDNLKEMIAPKLKEEGKKLLFIPIAPEIPEDYAETDSFCKEER